MLPYQLVGRPLPIAGLEWGLLLDEPTGQIYPGVLSALSLGLATVFDGGAKIYPFPGTGGLTDQAPLITTESCHVDRKLSSI